MLGIENCSFTRLNDAIDPVEPLLMQLTYETLVQSGHTRHSYFIRPYS